MKGDEPGTERRYRSKLEVLRDFLDATRVGEKRTRIIGTANLNVRSFRRYRDFCLDRGLIVSTSGGYALTPEAETCLEAIQGVLTKRDELNISLKSLERTALGESAPRLNGLGPEVELPHPPWLARSDPDEREGLREPMSNEPSRAFPSRTTRGR